MKTQDEDILIIRFLAGEASEADIARLNTWRESDASHEAHFLQSQSIWNKTNRPEEEIDLDAAWLNVQARLARPVSRNNYLGMLKIAAAVLLVCSIGWIAFNSLYNPMLTIQTAANEQKEIKLPDGSIVWLNELSSLRYSKTFKGNQRNVALTGEAFFEVMKNPEKPFIISSEQAITQVLGTSFNLRVLKGTKEAFLNVVTGKVRFTSVANASEVIVVAGEKAAINSIGNTTKTGPVIENELAWKSGKLVFEDASLKEVFSTLENYFKIKIAVDNPAILTCHFTGTFMKPEVDDIFNTISKALQLNYSRQRKNITIKGKGCAS
jgi:transmembrane sensor